MRRSVSASVNQEMGGPHFESHISVASHNDFVGVDCIYKGPKLSQNAPQLQVFQDFPLDVWLKMLDVL